MTLKRNDVGPYHWFYTDTLIWKGSQILGDVTMLQNMERSRCTFVNVWLFLCSITCSMHLIIFVNNAMRQAHGFVSLIIILTLFRTLPKNPVNSPVGYLWQTDLHVLNYLQWYTPRGFKMVDHYISLMSKKTPEPSMRVKGVGNQYGKKIWARSLALGATLRPQHPKNDCS